MTDQESRVALRTKLRRAKPIRLFEQAVEQIKTLILEGHLKPGDKLPSENELSKMLDVSRSSVREALRTLESNGIIEVRSGAGAFISEDALVLNSVNDAMVKLLKRKDLVLQLLLVRGAIESLSAAQAASNIEPEQLNALNQILRLQEVLIQDPDAPPSLSKLASLDEEFHIALSRASGNEIVYEIINALVTAFSEDNQAIFVIEKGHKLVDEHREILEALTHHDPIWAEAAMRKHIERVVTEVKSYLSDKRENPVE